MGLIVHSLENIPKSARRNYFIYLLDYGWHEPISQALRDNFDNMAQLASKSKAVIIRGTNLGDFQNEVLSWHRINNEDANDLLPALLVTNAHPSYFLENNQTFSGRRNILRVDNEYEEMKKGFGRALVDAIVLQPNVSGIGFNFNKIIEYFGNEKR